MSQFIEMFDFHELNLNSPSKDFESMCFDDTSSATKIPAGEYLQEGKYAVYDQTQEKDIAGYSNTEQGLCRNYPAVLFGDHSRVVKYINEPFFIGADGVKIIRPREDNLIPEFLYYDLKYHNIPNTGYNRHFKYIKMISLTKASLEEQSQFLSIAHQADKSGFELHKSIDAIDVVKRV
jgi:type I restriction enzyme S subunit